MQTATADPLVGRLLEGRYRILERIARGGMSIVYAAVDERLDRRVAVKVMSSTLSSDPAFTDRFAREARAAARLAHVNAVAVYDQGSDSSSGSNHVFLVMELVRGRTLRDLIRERTSTGDRFTTAEAISIMEPVLSALSAAHRAGLVHRDIKPENILLSDDGLVKVADFGLARAVDADPTSTRTGLMMGTVAYCSPEQIVHGHSDPRSDVYSAAIVLFELLVGRPPYQGESAMSVAYQHVHNRVPAPSSQIRQRPSGIASLIDEIVVDATDSDPSARPADASAFLAQLADARVELALPVVPIPPRDRSGANEQGRHARADNGAAPLRTAPQGPLRAGATTEIVQGPMGGRFDTELVRGPQPRPEAPPPPIVIPPPKRQRSAKARRRRRRLIALVVILLVGLAAAAAGLIGVRVWREQNAHVPKVSLQTAAIATAHLQHAGYHVSSQTDFSETVPSGQVISSDPSGGSKLAEGKSVLITVSRGPKLYAVPDFSGQTVAAAEKSLQQRGLSYNPTPRTRTSLTVPQSQIISTIPAAGKQIDRSTQVVFVVSSGKPLVQIPNIATNTPFADAKKALNNAHFRIHRPSEYSDTVDEGNVISVDPSSGKQPWGTTLTVTVSRGPHMVTVPQFRKYEPVNDVEQALREAHLKWQLHRIYGGEFGRVVRLSPGAGESVHAYSTITITVI